MAYQYLDDMSTADVAFRAWGSTLPKMFISAGDALMNVMVEDLQTIDRREERSIDLADSTIDMLLFQFLQEIQNSLCI